jgi:hypothetical protein
MPDALTPDVAERLLDLREPADGRHAAVAELLVAAAGPACPAELAGEEDTVREFRRAYRLPWHRRRAVLLACAGLLLVPLGGTAYAAGGGPLPGPVRRTVESLFGGRDAPPAVTPVPSRTPSPAPPATRAPSPAGQPTRPVEELCRSWEAGDALTGDERRALARAAKSETGINEYCRGVVGTPATAKPKKSHPVRPSPPPGSGAGR